MKILIACEQSGIVRRAFRAKGHRAFSCDLEPCLDDEGHHYQLDIKDKTIACQYWDMVIAFPPCTHLAVSGARYFKEKQKDGRQQSAIDFFMYIVNLTAKKIAIENPIGIMSTHYRKPDQIIQPWQFGHDASKATCLWLQGLPSLNPTNIIEGKIFCCGNQLTDRYGCPNCNGDKKAKYIYSNQTPSGQNKLGPSIDRAIKRSITYQGIADAMAEQWGNK